MAGNNEPDKTPVDQSALFARMLEGVAQLGEVQKLVARSLIDVRIEPKQKMLVSGNLAAAINLLNRASHLIMRASIGETSSSDDDFNSSRH